ncbi:glycerophosphodiester phosphodiesterase [Cumulibacter manganitolerans]|uniref:glycerophosphodiester phosphodiesterase n=1 Tax=Cumulibacter manganitolerans TaxID=1884992 RepID=UPI0012962C3D|nr:glycerophosphodiester phosphodiesterase family protein [Cumulibacter manganitolerans]
MGNPLLRGPGADPTIIAHRGASADAPENTMPAFELAFRFTSWLETDVQPTADGVPVLLHDADLDRTTDGMGPVRELAYADLQALDAGSWFSPHFARTPVPTLRGLLDALPHDGHVLLEIKGPHTDAQLGAVLEVVERSGVDERVLLQSFEREALARLHALRPERPLGLLTGAWDDDPVAECRRYGAVLYNPDHRLLEGRDLQRLHAHGIASAPYTADAPADWSRLHALGADAIITDRPGALEDWLAERP